MATLDISTWVKKAKGNLDLVVTRVTLDVFGRVIKRSPVDTGRFRGNWQFSVGAPASGTLDNLDRSGTESVRKIASGIPKDAAGKVYYLVNNLAYARALENGHSGQAPHGMIGLTVMEFEQSIVKASKNLP